jgi:hypothetical protein
MKARSSLLLVALAALLAPAVGAQDIGLEDRWTIAVQGGLDSEITGNVLSDVQGSVFDREVTIFRMTWRQTYEPAFRRGAVLIGFGVTPRTEIVARGSVYEMESPGILAGSVEGSDLFMQLERYKEYDIDLSYRYYLAWRTRMKSYIAPAVGVKFTDRILIESAFAPDRNSAIFNVPLYTASTVFTFGADVGFTIDLGSTFYVGLEAQLRYQTSMTAAETFPGLRGINDGGDRLSAPVVLTAGFRF